MILKVLQTLATQMNDDSLKDWQTSLSCLPLLVDKLYHCKDTRYFCSHSTSNSFIHPTNHLFVYLKNVFIYSTICKICIKKRNATICIKSIFCVLDILYIQMDFVSVLICKLFIDEVLNLILLHLRSNCQPFL